MPNVQIQTFRPSIRYDDSSACTHGEARRRATIAASSARSFSAVFHTTAWSVAGQSDPVPGETLLELAVGQPLLDLPQHDLTLELGTIARGRSPVRESGPNRRAAVEAIGDLHAVLGDPSSALDLDLLLRLRPPEFESATLAPLTGVGREEEPLVGDQRLASDSLVLGSRPRLPPPIGRNEGSIPNVAGSVVPHARRDVRVLVDGEASTELGVLSTKPVDLSSSGFGPTLQLLQPFLGDDDLIVLRLRGEEKRRIPSAHSPSGRGLTASRI